MTIIHVIESSGGSADFVLSIIRHIPQHSHCVIYSQRSFAGRFEKVQKDFPTVKFYPWKFAQREIKLMDDIKATVVLFNLLRNVECDVIHLHSSKAGFIGRMVCFLQRKKYVIYTPNGLAFLRKDVPKFVTAVYCGLEKFANYLNGEVVSCSKSEADAMISIGVKSQFINNGTEVLSKRAQNNRTENSIIIATVGRITIQKNPTLFNTIAESFAGDPNFNFLWIGSGELEHVLTSKNISITGWLDKGQVMEKIESIDIYISTALWEGLPFAVLEAMSIGKPVILSKCVGNVDLVKTNSNGFLFNTAQEAIGLILQLQKNKDLIRSFGEKSIELVKDEFDVVDMAKKYENTYQKMAKSHHII